MKHILAGAVVTTSTLTVALVAGTPADARQPSFIVVRTPTVATAYNGGATSIRPLVTATGHNAVVTRRLTVYRHGRKFHSGATVALKPGAYTTVTSGTYKSYTLVKQTRTRQVLHQGDLANANCIVTSATDDGDGYTSSLADCTDSYYPNQHKSDSEFDHYQVGDTYSEQEFFDDEYVSERYSVNVRKYGVAHAFASPQHKLTVRKGGYQHAYRGHGNYQTRTFAPPKSVWRIAYSFNCAKPDYTNFSITVYDSNGSYEDLAANDVGSKGDNRYYVHAKGKFYLEIEADSPCSWQVVVTS